MLTKTMEVDEAHSHFSELISLVTAGTEVVLTEKRVPLVRLVPVTQQSLLHKTLGEEDSLIAYNQERDAWLQLAVTGLERAYGDDEPEYMLTMLKQTNPDYERG